MGFFFPLQKSASSIVVLGLLVVVSMKLNINRCSDDLVLMQFLVYTFSCTISKETESTFHLKSNQRSYRRKILVYHQYAIINHQYAISNRKIYVRKMSIILKGLVKFTIQKCPVARAPKIHLSGLCV